MSDGVDLGEIQTRFGIDLTDLSNQIGKAVEMFSGMTNKIKETTSSGSTAVNNNLDITKGNQKMQEQLNSLRQKVDDSFKDIQKTVESSSNVIGKTGTKGFAEMKNSAGKDLQGLVDDINAKMDKARASQLKLQSLLSKKSTMQVGSPSDALKFDSQIASAQAQMTRYQTQAQQLARNMQHEFDAIPGSLKKVAAAMDQNEVKIDALQAKLKSLQSAYKSQRVTTGGDFAKGFTYGDSDKSLKTKAEIDKLQQSIQKLISENDALNQVYGRTEDRASGLKKALSGVNTELKDQVAASRQASASMANVSNSEGNTGSSKKPNIFQRMGDNFTNFRNKFKSGSSSIKGDSSGIMSGLTGINRTLKMMWSSVFIFGILGSGLTNLMGSLGSSLMVNQQFANSLNQIKVVNCKNKLAT